MRLVRWYQEWRAKWKEEQPIRWQRFRCNRHNHNWKDVESDHIQCKDPGCGLYLR